MLRSKAMRLLVATLCLSGASAFAAEGPVSNVSVSPLNPLRPVVAEWSIESGLSGYHHGSKDQGDSAYAHLNGNFRLQLAPWLHLVAKPRVDFYSSRVQESFNSEEYKNGIRLTEGFVGIRPLAFAELRAGFINQGFIDQDLLLSGRRAFPGAQEILSGTVSGVNAELIAEQVIPTSYSVDDQREDKESLPTLQVQVLKLSGKNFSWLEWKAMVGHFAWNNTPDKVAFESAQWGNSVEGEVAAGSRFRFGFDGWMAGTELCVCSLQSSLQWVAEFQRLANTQAAAGYGNAQVLGVGPRVVFGERVLDLRYRNFFLEKDATIAAYAPSGIGGTNRQGDSIEVRMHFKDYKFAVVGEWTGTTVIRDNDIQRPHNTYFLGVETDYAPF